MAESTNVNTINGEHMEREPQTNYFPSKGEQLDGDDQRQNEQKDHPEATEIKVPNCQRPGYSRKNSDFSSLMQTKLVRPTRKRSFLAFELSNSETGTLLTASPSGTSPSPSSPASSSSASSAGYPCHRNETNESSKLDVSEFESKLNGKRARCNLAQDCCYPTVNRSSGSCNSEVTSKGLFSSYKYQARLKSAVDQINLPDLYSNSQSTCCPSDRTTEVMELCPRLSKTGSPGEPKISRTPSAKSRQSKITSRNTTSQTLSSRIPKKETSAHSSSCADEDCEHEVPGGSELTIAAYNNFVRRVVDDTLDRNITFCEQPRHAITALENICARAWPSLDVKRHRNRIRAYLKACRRNSKKNRGQINMKEPAMNGLSMEARQLVANALSLVAMEVEQLKLMIQESSKLPLPSTSSSPGSSKSTMESNYLVNTSPFGVKYKKSDVTGTSSDQPIIGSELYNLPNEIPQSIAIDKDYHTQLNSVLTPSSQFQELALNHLSNCNSYIPSIIPEQSSAANFDLNYMSAMLRLLPTLMHSNKPHSSAMSQSTYDDTVFSHPNGRSTVKMVDQYNRTEGPKMGTINNFHVPQFSNDSTTYGNLAMDNRDALLTEENLWNYHPTSGDFGEFTNHTNSETIKTGVDFPTDYLEPPPAHINCIQYSPSLREAIGKLLGLDVYLTQEDTAYFRNNLGLAKEAIKYARAFAHIITNKLQVLEVHLQRQSQTNSFFTDYHPLNLS